MKKSVAYYFEKMFPNENYQALGSGRKSTVFRTESGKIVRIKSIRLGTYNKEARFLNFINKNGGLSCKVPDIKTFISFPFAFSVHNDFGGNAGNGDFYYNKLDVEQQKKIAAQLAEAFISLRKMGEKPDAKKIITRKKHLFFRRIKYFFVLLNKKEIRIKWLKLQQEYFKRNPQLVLTHNDLHFKNMIIDDNFNLIGLIDFENILFCPFEYNLRKYEKSLVNFIIDYWQKAGYEIDRIVLLYYRAEFFVSRLIMPSNRKNRVAYTQKLNEVLDDFLSLQT